MPTFGLWKPHLHLTTKPKTFLPLVDLFGQESISFSLLHQRFPFVGHWPLLKWKRPSAYASRRSLHSLSVNLVLGILQESRFTSVNKMKTIQKSLHFFICKNTWNFPEPQLFYCLFLNFYCSLAILSLNILTKFILIKKKECIRHPAQVSRSILSYIWSYHFPDFLSSRCGSG